MLNLFIKIKNLAKDILIRNLVVNASIIKIGNHLEHRNWGDDLNYYFLHLLSNKRIVVYMQSHFYQWFRKDNYLCIGSTIELLSNSSSIIWGAGFIDANVGIKIHPKEVRAVRGPLTRDIFIKCGLECPEVYGDPALLIPYYYQPYSRSEIKKGKLRIGIVPHYSDLNSPILKYQLSKEQNLLLIDLKNYQNWTDVIDKIVSCDYILSSSLHGLIIAEAYGIKNIWIEIDGKLTGGHFKFHDFFKSIKKEQKEPQYLSKEKGVMEIISQDNWVMGEIDLQPLLKSCPFKITIEKKYEHPMDVR